LISHRPLSPWERGWGEGCMESFIIVVSSAPLLGRGGEESRGAERLCPCQPPTGIVSTGAAALAPPAWSENNWERRAKVDFEVRSLSSIQNQWP